MWRAKQAQSTRRECQRSQAGPLQAHLQTNVVITGLQREDLGDADAFDHGSEFDAPYDSLVLAGRDVPQSEAKVRQRVIRVGDPRSPPAIDISSMPDGAL